MNLGKYLYLSRRLKNITLEDLLQRLRLWKIHREERHRLRLHPQAMTIERLYADRSRWFKESSGRNLVEQFNQALEMTAPGGWLKDEVFWETFTRLYPTETDQLVVMAEAVSSDRIKLFQWKEVSLSRPVRWSSTMEPDQPEQEWPDIYYADIDFHQAGKNSYPDVKWCWELNRFQHLLCLGAAWRITGQERFAAKAREHIESWMGRVHYPLGIQWSSNLEVGLRALSWERCHLLCSSSRAWDRDFLNRFITCIYLHGYHLEKELTVHHAEGNHLLGEAAALFQISVLYPLFTESLRWRNRSSQIIERLTARLILEDGVYAEQSTGYFRFVMEFLLPVLHLADHNGVEFSEGFSDRLAKGLGFIQSLCFNCKDVPMIGDSDTGLAIGWRLSDFWDFTSLMAAGAIFLDRPSLNKGIDTFPAESFLLAGLSGLNRFDAQSAKIVSVGGDPSGPRGLAVFRSGGYVVSSDNHFGIIFDAGPLGMSPGFGHGHADGLSFQIRLNGNPAIVDTGTMVYNGAQQWRRHFRGSSAHNTLRIDGNDPSSPLDTFRWSCPLDIELLQVDSGHDWRLLQGRLIWGRMVHQRSIIHVLDQGIVVMDFVSGRGVHELEWYVQFEPGWSLARRSEEVFGASSEQEHLEILFLGFKSGEVSPLRGSTSPMGGWYSRFYGSVVPIFSVRACLKTSLPVGTVMVIKQSGKRLSLPSDFPKTYLRPEFSSLIGSQSFRSFAQSPC
jgi:hypothetical protein